MDSTAKVSPIIILEKKGSYMHMKSYYNITLSLVAINLIISI